MRNEDIKKVILVHGYNGVPKIFDYFKSTLEQQGYQVIIPIFPTQTDITQASYFEVFDKYKTDFAENTVVVAHSVGNILLIKYLCQNALKVNKYIGLAGFGEPFEVDGRDDLNDTIKPLKLSEDEKISIRTLAPYRYAIYSDNDHIVPLTTLKQFVNDIAAEDCFIPNIGHMGSKSGITELPQVIELITD